MGGSRGVRIYSYNVRRVQLWEATSVMFEGSEDAKAQSWEGAMVGGHKCGRFERSEDAKV